MKMTWNLFTHLIIGVSAVSLGALSLPPVMAQQQFELGASQLQQGTILPVTSRFSEEAQYFAPDGVHSFTVVVSQNIFDLNGRLMLPAGSLVYGQFQPVAGGLEFVANSMEVSGRTFPLQASSGLINDEKDPREFSTESIAGDTAIGATAGAILGILTGGMSTAGVIGGAAAGVTIGNVTAPQVVVIRPGQSFNLTLQAPVSF